MENPEEVLQALDEFQKLRPSEIPRELEDYLCWVAKTGDPVYQWSLIKALFREKLMRVMTEFYESCPTLDLTPCPNVEQFNYDTMKSNLLERLESFANAPFTVQRICELLTTPRKEYNRIDKFMRAIEKNILVVSTREPGPYGRRSENGDNLVNGSIEDETSHHGQSSNDVEMENWVKDCTATTATPVHTGDNEDMSIENSLNSSLKTSFDKQDRIENQVSTVDAAASSFVTSSTDFSSTTTTVTAAAQVPIQEVAAVVQNLTTGNHEANSIGDVSDAIMNEDTSSQPSLELESDDNDSNDSKKLQTTFQAKDFTLDESKPTKTYSEALTGKLEENIEANEPNKESDELTEATHSSEKLLSESAEDLQNSSKTDNTDAHSITTETDQVDKQVVVESQVSEKCESESNISDDNFSQISNLNTKEEDSEEILTNSSETPIETKCDIDIKNKSTDESIAKKSTSETFDTSENSAKDSSGDSETEPLNEICKPIIEEPIIGNDDLSEVIKTGNVELTIKETTEDEAKSPKNMIPDPIPIIEEPKDTETVSKNWDNSVSVTEVINESLEDTSVVKNGIVSETPLTDQVEDNKMIITGCEENSSNKEIAESMDVDNEGLISNAQQDEPMEQETTEPMNS